LSADRRGLTRKLRTDRDHDVRRGRGVGRQDRGRL